VLIVPYLYEQGVSSSDMIPPADAAAYPGPHPESAAAASIPKLKQKAKATLDHDATDDRFSTADRTILEELKASIRAREAQFELKGVGHTVLGGGRCSGKKYHVYPKEIVPYPRSYERDVIDLCVFLLLFLFFFLRVVFPFALQIFIFICSFLTLHWGSIWVLYTGRLLSIRCLYCRRGKTCLRIAHFPVRDSFVCIWLQMPYSTTFWDARTFLFLHLSGLLVYSVAQRAHDRRATTPSTAIHSGR
jgi:hypothetical protein